MHPSKKEFWYVVIALLILPAFLINLGMMPLNDDEAIRTLVAMEMDFSGNFIVPTLNGAEYRAKPPLYNYFLYISYAIAGVNEWSARIPNLLFLGLFGYIIYFFSKKHFTKEYSILNGLMFVTCGRILFWDSMLAYIDISYSMITFLGFMVIFHQFQKQKWYRLFIISYALAGAGFLMKGFPSIIFQGFTLLAYFISQRKWRKLFSLEHLSGIIVFLGIVGGYYGLYHIQANLGKTLAGLLDQSTRRTAVHEQYDYTQFFQHLVTYPFENIYHFLPWSLMAVYMFGKKSMEIIRNNAFLFFCGLTFLVNIVIYWISVEVYPRYILMLIPLVFSIFLHLHKRHYDKNTNLYTIFFRVSQFLFLAIILSSVIALFQTLEVDISFRYLKMGAGIFALALIFICFSKFRSIRLISFIAAVLVMRIIFNFFFIPERYQGDKGVDCREQAINLGLTQKDLPLNIYLRSNIDLTSSVYIANERQRITFRTDEIQEAPGITIIDTARHELTDEMVVKGKICVREGQQTLLLVSK